MKKLLIGVVLVAATTLSGYATVYAGTNHNNNHNNGGQSHECMPQGTDEQLILKGDNHKERSHKDKDCTPKPEPCQYNDQLKATDEDCKPRVEKTPTTPPATVPETPPAQTTTTTTVETTPVVVDTDTSVDFQGK